METTAPTSCCMEALEPRMLLSGDSQLLEQLLANITTTHSPAPIICPDLESTDQGGPVPAGDVSGPLIGMDDIRSDFVFEDLDGSGYAVAILDTGIDLDHPFFGPDEDEDGIADRIVFNWDFADDDNDGSDPIGHGSLVSSIIGSEDSTYTGMAPAADLVALKVFPDEGQGTWADVEDALQWVVQNADTYNIVSVNMSIYDRQNLAFGISLYGLGDELGALEGMGVVLVAICGNDFYRFSSAQGVAYPAADPSVLAIGATYDANIGGQEYSEYGGAEAYTTDEDRICPYSQRHETLTTCFAPGDAITGANHQGGLALGQGTSFAAPHIAGLVPIVQQLAERDLGRRLTPDEFEDALVNTAVTINDGDDEDDNVTNTDLDFGRVDAYAMVQYIADQATVAEDDFESGGTSGGSGWTGNWSLSGHASIWQKAAAAHDGAYSLRLLAGDGVAARTVDMSGTASPYLNFWWRAKEFETYDYATVEVNDGSSWETVLTVVDGQESSSYALASIDLPGFEMSETFQVRVCSHMDGTADYFFIDDIRITGAAETAAPTSLQLLSDTGMSQTDGITMTNYYLQFQVSGTLDGATVRLYEGETLIDVAEGTGGDITMAGLGPYEDGEYSFTATQQLPFRAGSSPAADTVYVDTVDPTGSVPNLAPGDDTGKYTDDDVTQGYTPEFNGTASDTGGAYNSGVWKVQVDSDDNKSGLDTSGLGTYSVELATLNEGERSVTAKVYDVAGNTYQTAGLTVYVDRTPPAAPGAPDLLTDTGADPNDDITKATDLTFQVAGSPYFQFYRGDTLLSGESESGTQYTAVGESEGTHQYRLKAVDVAGNPSAFSAALPVTVDLTAPTPVGADEIATADLRPELTGTADDNYGIDTVVVTVYGVQYSSPDVTFADGTWTLTSEAFQSDLPRGYKYEIEVVVTDIAGNEGADETSKELTTMIKGDANEDADVDGADYTAWADCYHWDEGDGVVPWAEGGWAFANYNEDTVVDGADYTAWADHYGHVGSGGPPGGKGGGEGLDPDAKADDGGGAGGLLDEAEEPYLDYTVTDLGEGLYGYTFTLYGNDEQDASFFIDLTFEGVNGGEIQQTQAFGSIDVHTEAYAIIFDGCPAANYDMDYDSWFYGPFSSFVSLVEDDNYYHVEAGTGGGSQYEDADVAYIVCSGNLSVTGVASRLGVNYGVEVLATPAA